MTDEKPEPEDPPEDADLADEPGPAPRRRRSKRAIVAPIRVPFAALLRGRWEFFRFTLGRLAANTSRHLRERLRTIEPAKRRLVALLPLLDLIQQPHTQHRVFDPMTPELSPAQHAWLASLQTELSQRLATLDLTPLIEVVRRTGPPNWRDLDPDVGLGQLLEIAENGIPTAWVPRAAILEALATAAEHDRPALVVAHGDQVLDDCGRVCGEITAPELHDQVTLLREALHTAGDGHLAAAQALAAAIIGTTLLRHTVAAATTSRHDKRLKPPIPDNDDTDPVADLRWDLVHIPALAALDPVRPDDPAPAGFNRHACAHTANRYHPANALAALMLATSLLREAHEHLTDPPTNPSRDSTR